MKIFDVEAAADRKFLKILKNLPAVQQKWNRNFEEIREVKKNARRCTRNCVIAKILDEKFRKLPTTRGTGGLMTARAVSETISRLPRGAEQASNAASAYAQKKRKTLSNFCDFLQQIASFWIRLSRSRRPKSWDSIQGPGVPLKRNLDGHPSAGLF